MFVSKKGKQLFFSISCQDVPDNFQKRFTVERDITQSESEATGEKWSNFAKKMAFYEGGGDKKCLGFCNQA